MGIFYLDEVRSYLEATDRSAWGEGMSLSQEKLANWGKRGYFTAKRDGGGHRKRFLGFGELVTVRMVAILRSYGIAWNRIKVAHDYVQGETGVRYPFATKTFWTDDSDHPAHLYAIVDDQLVAADKHGQRFFSELRKTKIVTVGMLTFHADRALSWEPHDDVVINPRIQGGVPCLQGTRVPTSVLFAAYEVGYAPAEIADHYQLTPDRVETGLQWERRLRAMPARRAA